MGIIDKKVSLFDKEDVQFLDSMLKKFHDLKGVAGLPASPDIRFIVIAKET